MTLKEKAKQLKSDIPAVFVALRRKETPATAKILAGVIVIYALSPVDFIPDFIPVLGYLDDLILLPALIALLIRIIPVELFEECRAQSRDSWKDGKPKKWYFALPILTLWLLIVFLLVKLIFF